MYFPLVRIENIQGEPYFEVKPVGPADDSGRVLLDLKGKELGSFRQENTSQGKRASLTLKNNGDMSFYHKRYLIRLLPRNLGQKI